MKLIDKAAVVAEIERLQCPEHGYCLDTLLDFIDTLEVKEVDLEKEYKDFIKSDNGRSMFETAKHFFELGMQQSKMTTTINS